MKIDIIGGLVLLALLIALSVAYVRFTEETFRDIRAIVITPNGWYSIPKEEAK